MVWLVLAVGAAAASPLGELGDAGRWEALAEAVDRGVTVDPSEKKQKKELNKLGLGDVSMSLGPMMGTELVLGELSPVSGCQWVDGEVACGVSVRAIAAVDAGAYRVVCRAPFGGIVPLDGEMGVGRGDEVLFEVRGVERCWAMNSGELAVAPVGSDALQGVGVGTDLIPPELAALSWDQVESSIASQEQLFRACQVRLGPGEGRSGLMEVRYHIGEDGAVDLAEVATGTVSDAALIDCVLDRFLHLRFPPPMGGFEGGTYKLLFGG
jgi:hypothetical protein